MKCRICGRFSSAQTCFACDSSPVYLAYSIEKLNNAVLRDVLFAIAEVASDWDDPHDATGLRVRLKNIYALTNEALCKSSTIPN